MGSILESLADCLQCPACGAAAWQIVEESPRQGMECRVCHACYPCVEGVLHVDGDREDPAIARERDAAIETERDPVLGGINEAFDDLSRAQGSLREAIVALPHGDDSRYYHEPGYFANVRSSSPAFDFVARSLAPREGERLLDLGADLTWSTCHFARQGLRCIALDINHHLAVARVFEEQFGVRYDRIRADMTTVPFVDGSFEIVIGIDALHHAGDLGALAANIARMLVPGGRLGFVEPYCTSEAERETFGRAQIEAGISEHTYLLEEWHLAFTRAGLVVRTHRIAESFAAVYEKPARVSLAVRADAGQAPPARGGLFEGFHIGRVAAVADSPSAVAPGEFFEVPLRVENASRHVWCPVGAFRVLASYHLYRPLDAAGSAIGGRGRPAAHDLVLACWDNFRTPLPVELAPGRSLTVPLRILAPTEPGAWVAEVDLLQEHITWFAPHALETTRIRFAVR